jgi:hypothetical protein
MSDKDKKPDTPPAKADASKGTPAKNLDASTSRRSTVSEAAHAALEKSFGKTWVESIGILKWPIALTSQLFIKNFIVEWATVRREKADAKNAAETEISKAVASGEPTDVAEKLTKEMAKEANLDKDETVAVETLTEDTFVAAHATGRPGPAIALLSRVQEDSEKVEKDQKPSEVSEEQMRLVFSMGMFTLVRLKQRFATKELMEGFLTKVQKASGKSAKFAKLSKYLANHFKTMFKVTEDQIPSLLKVDSLSNLAQFGMLRLSGKDKTNGALDIILPDLFPLSVKHKGLPMLREFFRGLMAEKKFPGPAKIAELAFLLDENDLRDCAKRMGGAQVVNLPTVRETDARKAKAKKDAADKAKKGGDKKDSKPKTTAEEEAAKAEAEAEARAAEEQADKERRLAA